MAIDETEFRPGDTDNNLLRKILMTLLAGGGTSGGSGGAVTVTSGTLTSAGAVTIAEGADVTEGSTTDAATPTGANGTVISQLKGIISRLTASESILGTISGGVQQHNALTDRSGSVTLGGTSQQIAAASATRKYFIFQNLSIETLWINFGVAAVSDQPSFGILPQASFVMESFFISNQTINVIGATTGSKFTAKEGI